ncbi:MAG: hypothetical protein ACQETQ_04030 [Spirochaetota bacterium]
MPIIRFRKEERFRPADIAAMVIAAMQIMIPIILTIFVAIVAAYGLFMLAFH